MFGKLGDFFRETFSAPPKETRQDSIGSIGGIAGGESGSVLGSVNLTAPDVNKPDDKDDQPFFPSVFGVLDTVLGSLGSTAPEQEKQEGFTISSEAAPLQPQKPMQDLIFKTPVPSTEEPRPKGTGVTIQGDNIYTMTDDAGNVTGTLSALETLQDMKDAQDKYNLNFAGTTGTTLGDSMTNMPTLIDSKTGKILGQQMPNIELGTVATQEQFENQEQFIPPKPLFGIFDPVYASPQPSFDAQLQMGQDKDSVLASSANLTGTANEPITKINGVPISAIFNQRFPQFNYVKQPNLSGFSSLQPSVEQQQNFNMVNEFITSKGFNPINVVVFENKFYDKSSGALLDLPNLTDILELTE